MAKKNKKKNNEYSGSDEENENSKISGLKINSEKVLDHDFSSFINNEFLDISVSPSLDLSHSNIMNITNGKDNNYLNNFNLTNKTDDNTNENDDLNYNNVDSNVQSGKKQTQSEKKNQSEKKDNKNGENDDNSTDASNNEAEIKEGEEGRENVASSNSMIYDTKYNNEYTNVCKINDLSLPKNYLSNSMTSSMISSKESELCFIKYLTVCNFKSYENENIIGPFSKFTAIIGPNGSGKSNIMDCICFVLGIDNKYLRIKNLRKLIYHKENEKMENISKKKCYVKLTIECNNKETVELKRTLNYKGVTNFYINERLVNHDEYTNFLRRNRIETKTKTCLIFQGDIEEIINKKPTELSKLFEYISGSNEYEQIYEEIKERLKEKQISCKNLLYEKKKIEQEIKIHKIQINENIEHNKIKESYDNDIKNLYLFRLYHFFKKKEFYKEQLAIFKNKKMEFEQEVLNKNKNIANDLERKKIEKKKEFFKIDEQIKNKKNILNTLKIEINEIYEKIKYCQNNLNQIIANEKLKQVMQTHCSKFINDLNERLNNQNKILQDEYKNKLKIFLKLFNQTDEIKKFIKENNKKMYDNLIKDEKCVKGNKKFDFEKYNNDEEYINNLNIIRFIENLSDYKKSKENYLYLCANSNININNYTNLCSNLKKDIKELQEECDNVKRKKQKELIDLETEQFAYNEISDKIEKLNILIEQDKNKIEENKIKLKKMNINILEKEKEIENLEEEVNVLNIHKKELLSFDKKKDLIKNLKNMFGETEIYDEISNLYEVTNQIYYTPINNIIHKYNNFLLVKNLETCTKCIQYLKNNKMYKLDFIPYENFVKNVQKKKKQKKKGTGENGEIGEIGEMNENVYDEHDRQQSNLSVIDKIINSFKKKNIVLANNCLVCDENYKLLFDYLIGNDTIIIEKFDDADEIKKKFPQINVNMVTLDGHIISKNNNLIVDICSKYSSQEKYNNNKLNINIYNKLLNKKDECRHIINNLNKNIIEINELINKHTNEYELNKKKYSSIIVKKKIFEKEIEAKNMLICTYENKIDKIQNGELKDKKKLLINYDDELIQERNSLSSYQQKTFESLNNKLKISNIYEIIERSNNEIEKNDENIMRIKNNIKKLKDDINELVDKKNENNVFNKKENIQNENVKKELEELKTNQDQINKKIDDIQTNIEELENIKTYIHKNINTFNQELNELRDNINSSFEKHEHIENKIQNSKKKMQIYQQFIKDLLNECDINNINIFETSIMLKNKENYHSSDRNLNKKTKRITNQNKPNNRRKSKLLEDPDYSDATSKSERSERSGKSNESDGSDGSDEISNFGNISFDLIPEELKRLENENDINRERERLEGEIEKKKKFLKIKNINNNAEKEYDKLLTKLKIVDTNLNEGRKECNLFERNFRILQKKRSYKFLHCFNYIKNVIDNVYNNLTYNTKHHVGGQAFLDLCNYNEFNKDDEPFYCGIKYNNMPPMKRYFEISELSGGEKSISALALIFSIQKYINNSFIILDEVDANMDPIKITSLTRYLNSINSQVIVISLKDKFFSKSQTLVGVYKNKTKKCSKTITLDISKYRQDAHAAS
ncbi:chromosome segregation protein Smc1 [Plasmodium yoelii]|uniref:Structural maintenance of chromosomes protein 1 n=3 Tax=Plasmodium yoelii TaxID=5861 RepID=A0AAE9WQS2_PLAYO|nr:chromosome segregation protein Smc1 [Plasmodium yoelii]WBY57291.1 structural maintenance of chromosomes protein 1 [Plasmodium yoelii yoelii]CDU17965.1 structural maintenance of chromosome protein, putative, fragment [Plasmodium yoelii]VTZ78382.1 structural maintenance of chromosomes protein 1, putative [Plasmodium yoelii]|eukprot:XP_726100.2 chromosome segregation protein Smc1 [Plasmodium yoelii]